MNSIALLLAAAALGAGPELAWRQTDHSLALIRGPAIVWQFNYKTEEGKPYFSAAVLYQEPYILPAGKIILLKYRILFQPGPMDRDAIEKQWQQFAKQK